MPIFYIKKTIEAENIMDAIKREKNAHIIEVYEEKTQNQAQGLGFTTQHK